MQDINCFTCGCCWLCTTICLLLLLAPAGGRLHQLTVNCQSRSPSPHVTTSAANHYSSGSSSSSSNSSTRQPQHSKPPQQQRRQWRLASLLPPAATTHPAAAVTNSIQTATAPAQQHQHQHQQELLPCSARKAGSCHLVWAAETRLLPAGHPCLVPPLCTLPSSSATCQVMASGWPSMTACSTCVSSSSSSQTLGEGVGLECGWQMGSNRVESLIVIPCNQQVCYSVQTLCTHQVVGSPSIPLGLLMCLPFSSCWMPVLLHFNPPSERTLGALNTATACGWLSAVPTNFSAASRGTQPPHLY